MKERFSTNWIRNVKTFQSCFFSSNFALSLNISMTQLFNAVFTSEIMWEIYAKKFTRGREILRVYWKLFSRDGVKLSSEENILNFMLISTKCENGLELLRDTQLSRWSWVFDRRRREIENLLTLIKKIQATAEKLIFLTYRFIKTWCLFF